MIVFCFGTAIAYCIAVGDILEPIRTLEGMPESLQGDHGRTMLMLGFWGVLMLPLSLLRSVNSLQFSSFLGVVAILVLVVATVCHCATHRFVDNWECSGVLHSGDRCIEPIALAQFDEGMLTSVPLIMFAFTCQVNVFDVYRELSNPSEAKMMRVSWYGLFGICLMVYGTMGIFGYMDFLETVQGNILINMRYDVGHSAMITCAYVAITLTIVSAFPLVVFPCRESIFSILRAPQTSKERDNMILKHRTASPRSAAEYIVGPGARLTTSLLQSPASPAGPLQGDKETSAYADLASTDYNETIGFDIDEPLLPHTRLLPSLVLPSHDLPRMTSALSVAENYYLPPVPTRVYSRPPAWQHYLISASISVGAIVGAIFVPKIQVVFSLLGGVCSSFLCFIFPAMCVKKLGCCSVQTVGVAEVFAINLMQWGAAAAGAFSTAFTVYSTFVR